jgi:hypothetical protein
LLATNVHDITINTQCYSEIVLDVKVSMKTGHPGMLITEIITLEENTCHHVAHTVTKMLLSKVLEGA